MNSMDRGEGIPVTSPYFHSSGCILSRLELNLWCRVKVFFIQITRSGCMPLPLSACCASRH